MNTLNQTAINNNTDAAHPSLGKALTTEYALRRLNHKGYWAIERKGKIRVVEFIESGNGCSASTTLWFDTATTALEHYGMASRSADHCTLCGDKHPKSISVNPLGQWVCDKCHSGMEQATSDCFMFSAGRWTI